MPNEFPDESREESQVSITVGGSKVDAVYRETRFTMSSGAQPGTCEITVRGAAGFAPGSEIVASGAGGPIWGGLLFAVEHGDFLPAGDGQGGSAKTVLHGVDYNTYFDKLIVYNRDDPKKMPHDDKPWDPGTKDREIILYTLANDCDLKGIGINLVKECGIACFDKGIFFSPGMTLRGFFEKVSSAVKRSTPGSIVWYIDAEKQLVYTDQETYDAPFSVGDGAADVACRDFSFVEDISNIRNDAFVWANTLDPNPINKDVKAYFNFAHKKDTASINQYGRFQYGESQPHYMQGWLDARATKIITQQGGKAMSCRFSIFKGGLKPGMLVDILSSAHGISQKMPVRSITVDFPTPAVARYTVACSFDTQDPWGLLLAVRRPPQKGFTQPRFSAVDPSTPVADLPPVDVYTSFDEVAKPISDTKFSVSYSYITNSTSVWSGGLFKACGEDYVEKDQKEGLIEFFEPQVDNEGHRLPVIVSYQAQGPKRETE